VPCSRTVPPGYVRSSPVPVDAEAWSEDGKQSLIHQFPPAAYEDEFYQCIACGARSVFTALEQRETYEVRKAYIWQRRVLCKACWLLRRSLESELRACVSRWKSERVALRNDKLFLQRWLYVLHELPNYGRRRNNAIIRMLEHTLASGA
jgi:hypothetical protein